MRIFDFTDYLEFMKEQAFQTSQGGVQPKGKLKTIGRGEFTKIAEALRVHTTLISLLFSGKRLLTIEQACDLADYWKLTDLEKDYFIHLIQRSRAGNASARDYFDQKIESLKRQSMTVAPRMSKFKVLSDSDKAIFYSSWIYSGIRLFCSTRQTGATIEEIVDYFRLKRIHVVDVVNFLTHVGLLDYQKGRYFFTTQSTHLEAHSKHIVRHHLNWRMKSQIKADRIQDDELMFTSPFSVSRKDFTRLKKMFLNFIQESSKIIKDSPSEEVACINIDLFWVD